MNTLDSIFHNYTKILLERTQKIQISVPEKVHKSPTKELLIEVASRIEEQLQLYERFLGIWNGEVPLWAQQELHFPIDSLWIDAITERVEFDIKWRREWNKEIHNISPNLHHQLPELPHMISSENITKLLGELHLIKKSYTNQIWLYLRWINPLYYMSSTYQDNKEREIRKRKFFDKIRRDRNIRQREDVSFVRLIEEEELRIQKKKEDILRKEQDRKAMFEMHMSRKGVMTKVPEGRFWMGALDEDEEAIERERPRYKVHVKNPFYIGCYPVTQELYEFIMDYNPSHFPGKDCPVENVSWYDAIIFCNKLSLMSELEPVYDIVMTRSSRGSHTQEPQIHWNKVANGYRLPTEVEWEYAARAEREYVYSGSNNIASVAWYDKNSNKHTHPVGNKHPNIWGLYDMSGNVWEWVWDIYDANSHKRHGIKDQHDTIERTRKGGSWRGTSWGTRISCRIGNVPTMNRGFIGFRIAKNG